MGCETAALGGVTIGTSQLSAAPIAIVCLKVIHALTVHAEPQDMRLFALRTVEADKHGHADVLMVG